jgi:hypothetical protein
MDDVKGSFYEELEGVFEKFPKYHKKISSGGFNVQVGKVRFLTGAKNFSLHSLQTETGVHPVS